MYIGCHSSFCSHRIQDRAFSAGSSGLCILHLYIQYDTAFSLLASCQCSCREVGEVCHNLLGNSCGKWVSPTAVEGDRFKAFDFLFVLKCSSLLRSKVEFNIKIFHLEHTGQLEISVEDCSENALNSCPRSKQGKCYCNQDPVDVANTSEEDSLNPETLKSSEMDVWVTAQPAAQAQQSQV